MRESGGSSTSARSSCSRSRSDRIDENTPLTPAGESGLDATRTFEARSRRRSSGASWRQPDCPGSRVHPGTIVGPDDPGHRAERPAAPGAAPRRPDFRTPGRRGWTSGTCARAVTLALDAPARGALLPDFRRGRPIATTAALLDEVDRAASSALLPVAFDDSPPGAAQRPGGRTARAAAGLRTARLHAGQCPIGGHDALHGRAGTRLPAAPRDAGRTPSAGGPPTASSRCRARGPPRPRPHRRADAA